MSPRLSSLALLWLAAACGGGNPAGPTPPPPPPPPPPAPAPVASVTVAPETATLVPQQTVQLTATAYDGAGNALSGRAIAWSSSASAVATVSSTGLVTAVAPGSATITATSEGKSASAAIAVTGVDLPRPESRFECEARGHPCSLSGVPRAILQRSDALGDSARAMLERGGSIAQTAAWLGQQPDIAEVDSDNAAIRYRLKGGRAVWIFGDGLFAPQKAGATPAPGSPLRLSGRTAKVVVAEDTKQKKALVLNPFLWEMGPLDDGPVVAQILAGTRGYENGVTFLANAQASSTTVNLDSFTGLDAYQVIHISTHGRRVCNAEGCRAVILVGELDKLLPPGPGSKAEKLQSIAQPGVDVIKRESTGLEYLALTADFFRFAYPNGLDDVVVLLNACQSFGPQAVDLVEAIQGSRSVVFGWDEAVYVSDATAAATALYTHLSARGYPAEVAHAELGDLQVGDATPHGPGPHLRLSKRREGGDVRIRDVVFLLHPATGQPLAGGETVGIAGVQGDGQPDGVPFRVRVDGVKPELSAGMLLKVSVDGVQATPVPLVNGTVNSDGQWTVTGVIPLSYDLQAERDVSLRAWINLHSGGESDHEAVVTLSGEEPIMGTVWEMVAVQTNGWIGAPFPTTPWTAGARLMLRFVEGQPANEPRPRYVITSGTVTYDYNHIYGNCTYTAPVLTYEVTSQQYTSISFLAFNTTTTPVQYHGILNTTVPPQFEYVGQCDGGTPTTYTGGPAVTWLSVPASEPRQISADRQTITGTHRVVVDFGTYQFFRESNYTITRVQ